MIKRVITQQHSICRTSGRYLFCTLSGANSTFPGLFGLPYIFKGEDFPRLVDKSVIEINVIRDYLKTHKILSASSTLALLDSISAELCAVIDAAELCRNVHQSLEFKQGAEIAFERLSVFMHQLNADESLHHKLKSITEGLEWKHLSEEEQLFTDNMRLEFEADGIHLSKTLRDLTLQLRNQVVNSETAFSQNLHSRDLGEALIQVGPFSNPNELSQLKNWTSQYVEQEEESGICFTASKDRRIANSLLASVSEQSVRRRLWLDSHLHPMNNVEPLGELIKSRQVLARALGYPSYAHKALYNRAFKEPQQVQELLLSLSESSAEQAKKELQTLSVIQNESVQMSNGMLNRLFGGVGVDHRETPAVDVYPWDILYLSNRHGSGEHSAANERLRAQRKVTEYLSVQSCLSGLQLISRELFGIELEETPLGAQEGWVANQTQGETQLLQKFLVRDSATGRLIGTVLLDLFERDHKFPNAAHFTVQCGCARTHIDSTRTMKETAQLPIVALVFHFNRPNLSGHAAATSNEILRYALLSLTQVETLHHEWGHALHSLLSATRFQHLSGTRGGTDFVEIPSHWFEFYARSPAVISKWARHHVTGEPVPLPLLEVALQGARPFPAIDMQTQILYSAVDQHIFGEGIGDVLGLSPKQVFQRALGGIAQVQRQFTVLPLCPTEFVQENAELRALMQGTEGKGELSMMNMLDHGHLVNYGGGYYSYLFAKLYASHIWYRHFDADPLNRDAGSFLRDELLCHGSSRPTAALLEQLIGGKPDPSYFMRHALLQR